MTMMFFLNTVLYYKCETRTLVLFASTLWIKINKIRSNDTFFTPNFGGRIEIKDKGI